ncbi:MAG: hypothetical protein HQL26_02500 [Candidatus Omnitrophica bacterium]|nr:hypothetical protein [Candidatus Omnitrophota bacterium]
MIYVFLGDKVELKDEKLSQIKKSVLKDSVEAENFDYEVFYADDLSADDLKKSLITLPAVASHRVIVIKNIKKLNKASQEVLLAFEGSGADHAYLILDGDTVSEKDAFWSKILSSAEVLRLGLSEKSNNVFDMTHAILANNSVKALQIMEAILSEKGQDPLKMMGAVLWAWKNGRAKLKMEQYKKGLQYIQEADLNIKRSRLVPEHAMELLIVKLCCLGAC